MSFNVAPSSPLNIAIIGLGSQAKAWALNIKDSLKIQENSKLYIGLRHSSPSQKTAKALGLNTINLDNPSSAEKQIWHSINTAIMLIPDQEHEQFFKNYHLNFANETTFIYAHGFSVIKNKLIETYPQFHHCLLAPKAIASEVRFQYQTKGKIGAVYNASHPQSENIVLTMAKLTGFTSLFKGDFQEEMRADLFSEQSLLCSIIPYLSAKSYNLLREKGISKEIAFMECYLELRSITQAFVNLGPEKFFNLISPNALIGAEKGKNLLLDDQFDKKLRQLYQDIESGNFFKEVENDQGVTRQRSAEFWKNEELTQTFDQLKDQLI